MLRAPVLAALCASLLLVGSTATADSARVAILPIVVHTLEEPEYLKAGLADMLASRLGRAPGIAVVRVDGESAATTDPEAARQAGRDAGAEYVLFGSFTRFGDGASLDVKCLRVAGEGDGDARSIFIQSGSLGEVIPELDGLAEKVSRYVREGAPPSVAAASDGAGATSGADASGSIEAVRSELESLRARVQVLEEQLVEAGAEGAAARTGEAAGEEPELASELR